MDNKNISVLVVDDEEMIVTILMNFLSEKKYEVTGLTDAAAAIDLIHKRNFDIVFTDLMMPVVNGMELIKEIRKQDVDTQVIIFTGYASVDSAIDAVQQGVYDYIKKPFRLEDIDNILTHAVEKLKLQRENLDLHAQVEAMLAQITMLYDVSNIIYQVTEKKYAIEMLFDTMAESMAIPSALICQDLDDQGHFKASYAVNLPDELKQEFILKPDSKVNGKPIAEGEPSIITVQGSELTIDDRILKLAEPCEKIVLVPIRYQGGLDGFLVIFEHPNHENRFADELTLLKILATQIAPILGKRKRLNGSNMPSKELEPARLLYEMIQSEINQSALTDTPVSFAMARLLSFGAPDDRSDFPLIRESWRNMLIDQLGPGKRLHWAGIDTLLILSAGGNPVGLEHHLANARYELESSAKSAIPKPRLSMAYAIMTYPFDADSAKKITTQLSSRLFYDASEMNIKP